MSSNSVATWRPRFSASVSSPVADDRSRSPSTVAATPRRDSRSTGGAQDIPGRSDARVSGSMSRLDRPFRTAFTDLAATAIGRLAQQQAALRRVATPVARGVPPCWTSRSRSAQLHRRSRQLRAPSTPSRLELAGTSGVQPTGNQLEASVDDKTSAHGPISGHVLVGMWAPWTVLMSH
jgi:hypothetical protein